MTELKEIVDSTWVLCLFIYLSKNCLSIGVNLGFTLIFFFFFFVRYILVISGRAVTINVNPVSCVPNE